MRTVFCTLILSLSRHRAGTFAFRTIGRRHYRTTARWMSAKPSSDSNPSVDQSVSSTLRVLVLHGSEETGPSFVERIELLTEKLLKQHNIQLDMTAPTAPVAKADGFAWWRMPPGIRSFTADKYEGFEESASITLDAMKGSDGQFDLVLGHSQGAILLTALLTLGRIPTHPRIGYILNGVAVPNPFKAGLESLTVSCDHVPRVLFVLGENDKINPKSTGDTVKACFERAGLDVTTCYHPGGHSVPVDDDVALTTISDWIAEGAAQ